MLREASDQDLVTAWAGGDRSAGHDLVVRHAPAVARLARAIVGRGAGAEDVAQEALLRALGVATQFDPEKGNVRSWLLGVTRHVAFEALRQRRQVAVGDALDDVPLVELGRLAGWGSEASPEDDAARAETREGLATCLAALPAADREILVLREVEGLPGDRIAEMLGIDLAATKSRLHRARLKLMSMMRAMEEGVKAEDRLVGGMRCSEVLARVSDYVDGDVSATDRVRIENHLRGCAVCETFGGRFASMVHRAREDLGVHGAIDPKLVTELMAKLG